jgi:hypothetical protein
MQIPCWFWGLVILVIGVAIDRARRRHPPRDTEARCRNCGYILHGITEPRCPQCGERI